MKINRLASFLVAACMICVTAELRAFAWDDEYDFKDYHIEDNETSISGRVSVIMGEEKDLSSFIRYGATHKNSGVEWRLRGTIYWASSNPDIVSVNEKGVAAAHRVGAARITATAWDDSAQKHVQTVIVGVSSQKSTPTTNSFEIAAGTWLDLRQLAELNSGASDIKWVSSVPGAASVDSEGLVLAREVGRSTITASYLDKDSVKQTVKYQIRVSSSVLNRKTTESAITLNAGDKIDAGRLFYQNYQELPWALNQISCSTKSGNVLSADGLTVTAKAAGTGFVTICRSAGEDDISFHKLTVIVKD